jgi:triphosphoribosyl-dephospho-CoA synthase
VAHLAASSDRRLATLVTFLGFLTAFPDSHIVRKRGLAVAERIQRQASALQIQARAARSLDEILPTLLSWDAELKQSGINPGTSADLTVATVFVHRLRGVLPPGANSG